MVNEQQTQYYAIERYMITTICKIFGVTFDPNTSVVANSSVFAINKHLTLVCSRSMTLNIRAKYMHIWSTEKIYKATISYKHDLATGPHRYSGTSLS